MIEIRNLNGDNVIRQQRPFPSGQSISGFYLLLSAGFNFGNFDLSSWSRECRHDVSSFMAILLTSTITRIQSYRGILDRWTPDNPDGHTKSEHRIAWHRESLRVSLKMVLTWDWKHHLVWFCKLLNRPSIPTLRAYVSVTNAITITDYWLGSGNPGEYQRHTGIQYFFWLRCRIDWGTVPPHARLCLVSMQTFKGIRVKSNINVFAHYILPLHPAIMLSSPASSKDPLGVLDAGSFLRLLMIDSGIECLLSAIVYQQWHKNFYWVFGTVASVMHCRVMDQGPVLWPLIFLHTPHNGSSMISGNWITVGSFSKYCSEKTPAIDADHALKDRIIARALFLRAHYHFVLSQSSSGSAHHRIQSPDKCMCHVLWIDLCADHWRLYVVGILASVTVFGCWCWSCYQGAALALAAKTISIKELEWSIDLCRGQSKRLVFTAWCRIIWTTSEKQHKTTASPSGKSNTLISNSFR